MKKFLPIIPSDEDAENLLEQDLSEYLTPENFEANFTRISFEFDETEETIQIKLDKKLLDEIKATASKNGMEYNKFIAEILEQAVEKSS